MTGRELLQRARALAEHHTFKSGQLETGAVLCELINEIERMREASKGAATVVNQAVAIRDKAVKDAVDANAQVVTLSIEKSRLRKALDGLLSADLDRVEAEMGREIKISEMPLPWRRAHAVFRETGRQEGSQS